MSAEYRDRGHAGDELGEALAKYASQPEIIVLGLVRGGVPVAARVAERLSAPLDVLVVRKLGVPWAPEVAFGALGPAGVRVLNPELVDRIDAADMDQVMDAEQAELSRRERLFRPGKAPLDLAGRVPVIVDDGLATGATSLAACIVAHKLGAGRVVMAAPVGSVQALHWLHTARADTDDVIVCPVVPRDFTGVGEHYQNFDQVTDAQVLDALNDAPGSEGSDQVTAR